MCFILKSNVGNGRDFVAAWTNHQSLLIHCLFISVTLARLHPCTFLKHHINENYYDIVEIWFRPVCEFMYRHYRLQSE